MKKRRLVTISYTGLDAGGGVPKFNRDLHQALCQERECVHFCWDATPFGNPNLPEWEKARVLNTVLLKTRRISHEDVIVADGFWAAGLESFPYAISHSHGIWGHITWKDAWKGHQPENPFHHAAQVAFRGTWANMLGKRITAVSEFIAYNMEEMWQIKVDRIINNGVDTLKYRPLPKTHYLDRPLIIHGINDRGNLNKGWDHIEAIIEGCPEADVMSLDEAHERFMFFSDRPWQKHEVLSQATLVVHPSGFEGNSMFVAEALASGVPIVGYDVGFLWSVSHYDMTIGRIMDRDWRSPDMTLKHVRDVLSKESEREEQGKVARRVAEAFLSIEQFRRSWNEYIHDVEDGRYDK